MKFKKKKKASIDYLKKLCFKTYFNLSDNVLDISKRSHTFSHCIMIR